MPTLTDILLASLGGPDVLEQWLILTSAKDWVEKSGEYSMPGSSRGTFEIPLPAARLYQLGRNAFFEFQGPGRVPEWESAGRGGENVLNRSFGGVEVLFIGHHWRGGPKLACERYWRRIVFLSPTIGDLNEAQVLEVFRFYDSLLPWPGNLEIRMYETLPQALRKETFLSLSLFAMHKQTEDTNESDQGNWARFDRDYDFLNGSFWRKLSIYSKDRLVVSKNLADVGHTDLKQE